MSLPLGAPSEPVPVNPGARSTREVAELLNLSVKTIETHRAKIVKKLGLANATQLLHRAIERARSEEGSG